VLRKLLWIAMSAAAVLIARKAAERAYRVATGEEPPVRR
jgi:hypothetical protein